MWSLSDLFWKICLLKKGPQDLPAAGLLLLLLFLLYMLAALIEGLVVDLLWLSLQEALLTFIVETAVIYGMLSLRGYGARFYQTISAFLGTGLVLMLIALPMMSLFRLGVLNTYLFSNLLLILIVWRIVISAHILRNALSIPMGLGAILGLGFFILSLGIHFAIAPEQS